MPGLSRIIFCALILVRASAFSNDHSSDSLRYVWFTEKAKALVYKDYKSSLYYGRQVLSFTRKMQSPRVECSALNQLGFICREAGKLDSAVCWYQQALALCDKYKLEKKKKAGTFMNLGGVYDIQGKYKSGLECF